MAWWNEKKPEEGKEEEVTLPKVIQDQLDEAKGTKLKVEELSTKLDSFNDVSEWVKEQRVAAAKPKPRPTKTAEESEDERAELAGLLLTDPEAAYAKMAAKTNAAVMLVRADNIKREVFEDNAEKFPYYSGEVKLEINKILEKQTLDFRNSPEALENTYYTVVGKMHKEISEGKIKDRFASSTSSRGSGKIDNEQDERKITKVTPDIERAAKLTGIKLEDYMALLNEDAEAYI